MIATLVCTVVLLVIHGYFLFGSLPLLILKHDTPMDARFVRGFFNTYCWAAMLGAAATALSLALAGRSALAAGAFALALLAYGMRLQIIPRMDSLRSRIQAEASPAIAAFRRLHATAILLNILQLTAVVWSLIAASRAAAL